MKKYIFLFVLIGIIIYTVPIKFGNKIFYKYDLYMKKSRDFRIMHIAFYCETRIQLTSYSLPNDIDAISGIISTCTDGTIKDINNDLLKIVKLYKLESKVKNTTGVEIGFRKKDVKFPYLIKYLNKQKTYPKDMKNYYKNLLKKGISSERAYKKYTKIIHQYVNKANIYNDLFTIFTKQGCSVTLKEPKYFTEFYYNGNTPEMESKYQVIKSKILKESKVFKKYFPDLKWITYDVKCKRDKESQKQKTQGVSCHLKKRTQGVRG